MRLYGVGKAVDIIVVSPKQVEQYCDSPYLVISPATKDGVVIYNAEKIVSILTVRTAKARITSEIR
jgi:hypothetical protein